MGGAPCTVLGSEDTATENPASAQTLALQKIQKNAPKPANPSATGQEGTLAQLPNITSLTLPESITAITSDSFADCPQLATITVAPNNPTYASIDGLLYNKALTRVLLCPESAEGVVSLPDQTDAVPASALSHCANLHTLLVGQDNAVYTSINGSLYSKDASTLVACPGGIGQTLTLPKQTTTIGPDALAGITTLKSIVVLGTITTIDPTAFNDQAKQNTTIALPAGEDYETRKQVWQQAGFKNFATPANPGDTQTPGQPGEGTQPTDPSKPASGLTYKLLEDYTLEASWTGQLTPESTPTIPTTAQLAGVTYTVSALAPNAFENQTALTAITLPSSLTSIGARAFAGTGLATLDIPASITSIGDQAFANCPNLTRIITHTNALTVAPTALEACTNLEVWCPYNQSETYPWVLGVFATNNHIKAYGLPASQQPLTLEVGQSASLFEPGTLKAPDPSKTVYAYEATCLSVSQEGTITAKAPGTTTISTSIELEEIPLTHTTRTISVVAPTPPTTPEPPETPTPTPPNAQPITPRYPPNLATPTQASAPLYSRGAAQPRVSNLTISVTMPVVPAISIDATGKSSSTQGNITSTATEPIRVTQINCTEDAGAKSLLPKLEDRTATSVTVAEASTLESTKKTLPLKPAPGHTWPAPEGSALFRVNPGIPLPITFGLDIPKTATYNYLGSTAANFATVTFTFDFLAPVAASLNLSLAGAGTLDAPKVGDTLTATPQTPVAGNLTYTWYALNASTDALTPAAIIKGATSQSFALTAAQTDKFICCQISNNGVNRPVASQVTGKVTKSLNSYSWDALSKIAADLSTNGKGSTYYNEFHGYLLADQAAAADSITGGAANRNKPEYHKLTTLPDGSTLEVRIVGINHETDIKVSDSKPAGLTFMATHSLPTAATFNSSGNNTGGWYGSPSSPTVPTNKPLRTRMQPDPDPGSGPDPDPDHDIWNTLPPELTKVIKPVKKRTNNDNGTYTGTTVTTTDDYLWLPSRSELAGDTINPSFDAKIYPWTNDEGKQYEFFQEKVADNTGNTILESMDQKQDGKPPSGASDTRWWERSCYPGGSYYFLNCTTGGNPGGYYDPNDSYGVVLGFSL